MEEKCPHCGEMIRIIGCRTCEFVNQNYTIYKDAKQCWDCNMFHRNYKKKEE